MHAAGAAEAATPAGSDDEEEVRTVSVARSPVEGEDADDETIGEHANDTEALQRRRNEIKIT